MSFIGSSAGGGVGAGSTTPAIQNSLRFRGSATAYCNRSFTTPTTQNKWTFSVWFKIGAIDEYTMFCTSTVNDTIYRHTNGKLYFFTNGASECYLITNRLFRDPAAWMHLVIAYDTSQATAANRARMYINGVEETSFSTSTYPSLNASAATFNTAVTHWLGRNTASWDGLMANVCFVDGQQLTPSAFGATDSTSGEWKPKTSAAIRTAVGSFGTNGFMLMFNDATSTTTLGYDRKTSDTATGGNNWTLNNFSVTAGVTYDAFIDSPNNGSSATQPVGNYATLNPLKPSSVPTRANLQVTASQDTQSTLFMETGKFYCECTINGTASIVGIGNYTASIAGGSGAYTSYRNNGNKEINGSASAYGATYTTADVIGIAYDATNATLEFYKNNTSQGQLTSVTAGPNAFIFYSASTIDVNFGQRPFAYTPPTGYKALCSANLGTPAIDKPSAHFFAKTRTGTGSSYSVTGLEFSPGICAIKGRSGATDWAEYDPVRGVQKDLGFNLATAETTQAQGITAFNSDGYTGGTLAKINTNAATYIDYFWKTTTGAGSSNTDGSITSTVAVNTVGGISCGIYTGTAANATVGHGLGVAPKMVIIFNRPTGSLNWIVYHASVGNTAALLLNSTGAAATSSTYFNNTSPTTTTFSIGTTANLNTSGASNLFYAFAEIAGFSKFGSYTGNGSSDGPFVYCGFRPRWILFKPSTGIDSWGVYDTARNAYNDPASAVYPNNSGAEITPAIYCDVLSNGFKLRSNNSTSNWNANTIIYAAFAESPLQYANAR